MHSSVNFTLAFNEVTNKFVLTDAVDYTALDVDLANAVGAVGGQIGASVFKVLDLDSPDVDPGVSLLTSAINLPTDLDDPTKIRRGTYNFTYSIRVTAQDYKIEIVDYDSVSKTYYLTGDWSDAMLGVVADFTIEDGGGPVETGVTINSVSYDASSNRTAFKQDDPGAPLAEIGEFLVFDATFDLSAEKTFDFSFVEPTPCISVESDCCCSSITMTDTTAYGTGTGITRAWTAKYPAGVSPAKPDESSGLLTWTITPIYTGTWTISLASGATYQINAYTTYTSSLSITNEHLVDCSTSLCSVSDCIVELYEKYLDALAYNPTEAKRLEQKVIRVVGAWMNYSNMRRCGDADASIYLNKIKEIAVSCGCSVGACQDGTGQQVVPICQSVIATIDGSVVIQSDGTGIKITQITVAGTTTFTFSLDSAILNQYITTQLTGKVGIQDLYDVEHSVPYVVGDILFYNGTKWVKRKLAVNQITDVDIAGIAQNHVLYWDTGTSKWKNKLFTYALDDLSDIVAPAPTDGQVLTWDTGTSKWISADPPAGITTFAGLSDVDMTGLPTTEKAGLYYDDADSKWHPEAQELWIGLNPSGWAANKAPVGAPYKPLSYKLNKARDSFTLYGAFTDTFATSPTPVLIYTFPSAAFHPTTKVYFPAIYNDIAGGQPLNFMYLDSNGELWIDSLNGITIIPPVEIPLG